MSAPSDLTTLAACKAWLGLTTSADDALLGDLVTSLSRAILADLGRPNLMPTLVTETRAAAPVLVLRHWPVAQVVGVAADGIALPAATTPGRAGWRLEAADAAPPGAPQRLWIEFAPGPRELAVTYQAGYAVRGEIVQVPATAPFVATAQAPFGAWALDAGVTGARGPYGVAAGVYTFTPADAGATVTLAYGYVPADLSRAACEWVADRYVARGRIGQGSKSLGGQETTSFIVKAMPDVVDRLIRPYRRVAT